MKPPYYAVIFTSLQKENTIGYKEMATKMELLAKEQPGFLAMDHARENIGITISYWESLEAIYNWKRNADHQQAQLMGRSNWYKWYSVKICKVERTYEFPTLP